MSNVYQQHGCEDRKDYLQSVAAENDVDLMVVYELADMLGPSEDFDGLISAVQDIQHL